VSHACILFIFCYQPSPPSLPPSLPPFQQYMERELSALLAVAERNLASLTPEAVSTIINAVSKLHPR